MRSKCWWCVLAGAALVISFSPVVRADGGPEAAPKKAGDKPPAPPKPDFPEFGEVMKDFEEVPTAETPFITLWYNKKTDTLRAQLPGGLINQRFLVATSMSGGPVATGFQLDHFLAYFERMDKKLVLMRVDPRYVEGTGDQPVADVIKRSYGGDIIMTTIPILTMKGADLIVELDGICKSDFSEMGLAVNPSLSKWAKYKSFPQNVELSVDLAMSGRGSAAGKRMLFHYSISRVPESVQGYQPRLADDRIGYFITVRKDWTKKHNADTLFNRYINRWRLEKRDPSAELSAPKNPVIWHIEKTVPLQYRRWVKEGILEWNKAFEKCGYLDAIEVKQQEDYDKDTKDLDPEDVRYNFFRWIVTGRGFAMGPSREYPLTGQILDADIVFDDAMVRSYLTRYERLTGGEEAWKPYNPVQEAFFDAHPEWQYRSPIQNLLPNVQLREDPDAELQKKLMDYMSRKGRPFCDCAAGMAQQMEFAGVALEAKGLGRDSEEFIGQIVKEVVMHEVGHCLGLRHNFKASTWLSMNDIEEHGEAGDANVGSVMDYNPPIISARGEKQGSFTTRSIGPYDYWAIEYGYRPAGKPYKNEEDMLSTISKRVAEAGLDYATDEDTMGFLSPDPLSNRFDMGRDLKAFADRQIKLADSLMEDINKWAVKDGASFTRLRKAFTTILSQRAAVTSYVARFPGGQIINRDHKGDPDGRTPIEVVDAEKQRQALEFVCENVFAPDAYQINPELLAHLGPGRYGHWDSDDFDFFVEFNIHDFVSSAQYQCLFTLMNPFTIGRIHDNQVKFATGQKVYSLAEHINTLTDEIWSEMSDGGRKGTEEKPFINSFRRNLQRNHITLLMNLILSEPGSTVPADANAIARLSVANLSKKIGSVLKSGDLDVTSEAHLTDVKKRIDKALEAEYAVGGGTGGGGFFFFREAQKAEERPPVTVLPSR